MKVAIFEDQWKNNHGGKLPIQDDYVDYFKRNQSIAKQLTGKAGYGEEYILFDSLPMSYAQACEYLDKRAEEEKVNNSLQSYCDSKKDGEAQEQPWLESYTPYSDEITSWEKLMPTTFDNKALNVACNGCRCAVAIE